MLLEASTKLECAVIRMLLLCTKVDIKFLTEVCYMNFLLSVGNLFSEQESLKTEREKKREKYFPMRKYAIKA